MPNDVASDPSQASASSQGHDVFLSYNSADALEVEDVARRLTEAGIRCWLDQWSLVRGNRWMDGLERGLANSRACAVFCGRAGMGPWQEMEQRLALHFSVEARRTNQHFRVIAVRLPGAPPWSELGLSPFLRLYPSVQFRSVADSRALRLLKLAIRGRALGAPTDVDPAAPYVGMRSFRESDAQVFFGRNEELAEIEERLESNRLPRFLSVLGASGSGKSSLVFGGLIPHLRDRDLLEPTGSLAWTVVTIQPGTDAVANLRSALNGNEQLRPHAGRFGDSGSVPGESALHDVVATAFGTASPTGRVLVVVDQFESLFTQRPQDARLLERYRSQVLVPFLALLTRAAREPGGPVTVLTTARSDFFDTMADEELLAPLIEDRQHRLVLQPLSGQYLRDVIERPALALGADFEEGLVDAIVEDFLVQPAGALPFLQEALARVWDRRDTHEGDGRGDQSQGRPVLALRAYQEIGRLRGALDAHAERVWQALDAEGPLRARAVPVLMHLARLAEGDEPDTKRRVAIDDLPGGESGQECARRLAEPDARLITLDQEVRQEQGDEPARQTDATVELSHEALLKGWRRLNGWLQDAAKRPDRLRLRNLEATARAWESGGEGAPELLGGSGLRSASAVVRMLADEVPPSVDRYLSASRVQRAKSRRTLAAIAVGVVAVGLFLGRQQWNRTREDETVARLLSESRSLSRPPDLRFLLAEEALARCRPEYRPMASMAMLQASIDLGSCESRRFLPTYWFGAAAPWDFRPRAKERQEDVEWLPPGKPSRSFEGDVFPTDYPSDPARRWAFLKCAVGAVRFDLTSRAPDFDATWFYDPRTGDNQAGAVFVSSSDGKVVVGILSEDYRHHRIVLWRGPGLPSGEFEEPSEDPDGDVMLDPAGRYVVAGKQVLSTDGSGAMRPLAVLDAAPNAIGLDGDVILAVAYGPSAAAEPEPAPPPVEPDPVPKGPEPEPPQSKPDAVSMIVRSWDARDGFASRPPRTLSSSEWARVSTDEYKAFSVSRGVAQRFTDVEKTLVDVREHAKGWSLRYEANGDDRYVVVSRETRGTDADPDHGPTLRVGVGLDHWQRWESERPASLSPDGRWLAVIGDTLRIWNLGSADPFASPSAELNTIHGDSVRFSPDGAWLAAADSQIGSEVAVHVLEINGGATDALGAVVSMPGDVRGKRFLDFDAKGRWLICPVPDPGVCRFWDLRPTHVQRLPGRELTEVERSKYLDGGAGTASPPSAVDLAEAANAAQHVRRADAVLQAWADGLSGETRDANDDPAGAPMSTEQACETALQELNAAKDLNPTLRGDPATHVGVVAAWLLAPIARDSADAGEIDVVRSALAAIKKHCSACRIDERDLVDRAVGHWTSQAQGQAAEGNGAAARAALVELERLGDPDIEGARRSVDGLLAVHDVEEFCRGPVTPEAWESVQDRLRSFTRQPAAPGSVYVETIVEKVADWLMQATDPADEASTRTAVTNYECAEALLAEHGKSVSATSWNRLAWGATLAGHAGLVVEFAKRAVDREPSRADIRDTLGVALAVTGDLVGAAEQFQWCLEHQSRFLSPKVLSRWISLLRAGSSPFTPELLSELKNHFPREEILMK